MRLSELKGIGEKTEAAFNKAGIEDVEALLEYFPREYELYLSPASISEIGCKTFATVCGMFKSPLYTRRGGKLQITTGILKDELGGSIRVTWFNAPYMRDNITPGVMYILRGRVTRKDGFQSLNQPKVYKPEDYAGLIGKRSPVYPLPAGISNQMIIKAMRQALESPAFFAVCESDPLPEFIRKKYSLMSRGEAVRNLHFPEDDDTLTRAADRMSFEEIFIFIMTMKQNTSSAKTVSPFVAGEDVRTKEFRESLPYELTPAQNRVISEITADMSSGYVMNRLVQGDVGSGKTIVALLAMMNMACSGAQSVLMAPTEVLAAQHFETITGLFREYGVGLHAGLLTGSMTALEKKVVYEAAEDGRIDIIVGTHALFQENVHYKNLGLVITDEQHRFGIKQREALADKGKDPHMLVMSATPIPRTLALILYGNMDISVIDQLPSGRKPVKNAVIDDSYRKNAYRLIEREVAAGHQVYIICSLVEYSDGIDAQNVIDYTDMLRGELDRSVRIGSLYGRMKPKEKNEIMEKFGAGEIDVLVSTTVIEVGVNAPNATVMLVEDADRFGLATLHQLRGRVGRGDSQSYCMFMCNKKTPQAKERLSILAKSNDGFEIAAKDLEMRGPGEFFGTRQSGAFNFKSFDVYRDGDIAVKAAAAADFVLKNEEELSAAEKETLMERCAVLKGNIAL